MNTYLFSPNEVSRCIEMPELVEEVENCFRAQYDDDSVMPPKTYVDLPQYNGDFRAMPAYVDEASGIKWVNSHTDNPAEHGLPAVMGVMIYSDPETAYPLAIMDGTRLTRLRTGAAAGVATSYLAPEDASSVGIVGAGGQSHTQLEAMRAVRDIEEVVITDLDDEAVEEFVEREDSEDLDVRGGTPKEVCSCDIVNTVTPSREPIVRREWISPGTHVNAMGADAEGKQELDPEILREGFLVVDSWEQASHSGEINVSVSEGELGREDVDGEIDEVVAGKVEVPDDAFTIFDATGLAIQDVVTARLVYEKGKKENLGSQITLTDDEE
ncbi:MAG: ornithine cyclodeaminase family protein [Halobacteria archaeon]